MMPVPDTPEAGTREGRIRIEARIIPLRFLQPAELPVGVGIPPIHRISVEPDRKGHEKGRNAGPGTLVLAGLTPVPRPLSNQQ